MRFKDVSFWCVVLVVIVAMTFHHILSSGLIEGNVNMDDQVELNITLERSGDLDMMNENNILRGEIDDLRDEILTCQGNLKNSVSVIDKIVGEASSPVDDVILNGDGSDIEDTKKELIFPYDNDDHIYEITTCGKMGKDPPNTENKACNGKHTLAWFRNSSIYGYDDDKGIHRWTVPKTGSYIIEAAGSPGGTLRGTERNDIEEKPGHGAIIKGIFYLKKGDKYNIVIGQKGTTPEHRRANPWNGGAGAGGGTFMWKDKGIPGIPLIVAGGGGGQGAHGHKISGYGGNGSLTEDGEMGPMIKREFDIPTPTNVVDNFGKDGYGGGDSSKPSKKSKGWNNIVRGDSMVGVENMFESESGFGGGGILSSHAGGGGGGYSGGGSMRYGYSQSDTMGGGGGGSFFDDAGFKREDSETLDYNEEHGYLTIKLIKEVFFVEGNQVRCQEHGGYEPSTKQECEEGSKLLGFEWDGPPRKNGWNNNDCKSGYSKCIWSDDSKPRQSACGSIAADKGLIYNEKCSGKEGYKTNGIDAIYKTVCVSPAKPEDPAEDPTEDPAEPEDPVDPPPVGVGVVEPDGNLV